jgi:RNA polymerase sigma-70 factor (ECF subfamily)
VSDQFDETNRLLARALERCAAGDRNAFTTIYNLTAGKFTAIIRAKVDCSETTRDILQRAYTAIWLNAGKYDPAKAKPFTWMLVIMRNRAVDALRERDRAHPLVELDDGLEDDISLSPDQRARLKQAGALMSRALADLPEPMAQAVLLHVTEGYTCNEIGDRLGVSPNTVKSWIRRGLQQLRQQIPYDTSDTAI